MLKFFRERRIEKYKEKALAYIRQTYIAPETPPCSNNTMYCLEDAKDNTVRYSFSDVRYSERNTDILYSEHNREEPQAECDAPEKNVSYSLKEDNSADKFNASEVSRVLRNYSNPNNYSEMLRTLENNVNQTFVDRLLYYINKKGVRDSEVYKAAQVDKRLFSKMVSNREYKPSKDTAIAFALALELSPDEANDMLSRAGYTFSHSNKRDIIIEFFFREKVYNLFDANDILHRLNQKPIGRF